MITTLCCVGGVLCSLCVRVSVLIVAVGELGWYKPTAGRWKERYIETHTDGLRLEGDRSY